MQVIRRVYRRGCRARALGNSSAPEEVRHVANAAGDRAVHRHRVGTAGTAHAAAPAAAPPEPISVNDNRTATGTLNGGVLMVRLEARTGEWHPDGDADLKIIVNAFGVENGPLQIPGPLIRVIEGTEIRVRIRNRPDEPLVVHGLFSRPSASVEPNGVVSIPAGEVRENRFVAGAPGTYFYWAASNETRELGRRSGNDAPPGAFIVDPKGSAPMRDRVLVATSWNARTVGGEQSTSAGW